MVEQKEMVKVYDLAKEIGIDSISLLDQLKKLDIHVKNHMSELSEIEVNTARTALRKSTLGIKKTTPKAKKTKEGPKTSSTTKSGSPSKTTKQTAVLSTSVNSEEELKKTAPQVIRRRLREPSQPEPMISLSSSPPISESLIEPTPEPLPEAVGLNPSAVTEDASGRDMAPHDSTENLSQPVPRIASEPPIASETPAIATPSLSSETTTIPPKKPRPPIILPPRPVAPRKSILKIVEPVAPPPRPIIKPAEPATTNNSQTQKPTMKGTTTNQDKDGFRIIRMTKENLDQMVEEEAAKKRGLGREMDVRPEDVRFADYRKKELVFLPKKKKIPIGKEIKQTQKTVAKAQKRVVEFHDTIRVQDLANQLSVKASDIIRQLMQMGQMANVNQWLDFDTASLIASEYQYEVKNIAFNEQDYLNATLDTPESLRPRPPVVTIMGHVDHGKTTLLDAIREANVAAGESGGITQHIGAYTVQKNGKLITFIDTPGHEAFTVMRARGAHVTDLVILVVSADDGVMPQTREAISHAQAARVPIIVAINKMDKVGAQPEKIKQSLADLNLLAEDWGGDTQYVAVSALQKTNLDQLLDAILLQAEMLDLQANPDTLAEGTVLESRLEKGKGAVISVLVHRGTLRLGDPIVSGSHAGKVKALMNDQGSLIEAATPGIAVEVLGFEGLPHAGDSFNVTTQESQARAIASNRLDKTRAQQGTVPNKVKLEDLFSKIQTGDTKELNVVLKADTFGSVEAIRDSLLKLASEKVKIKLLLAAPGGITESDVLLASASNAIILGFHVRPETKARQIAEAENIQIKTYNIIYELLDDMKKAMLGLLEKKKVEKFLGRAEVRQTFFVPKIGLIAGSSVIDGKMIRGAHVRLLRESRIIYEGKMSSLKRFKEDAKEVNTGFECGIGIENYQDVKAGDIIEVFHLEYTTPEMTS